MVSFKPKIDTTTLRLQRHDADLANNLPPLLVEARARSLSVSDAGLISINESGPMGILAATDGSARVLEELQFTLAEGPCIDSSISGRPVLQSQLRS